MTAKHTPGELQYWFRENGGYDCMTDAFAIGSTYASGVGKVFIADIDCGSYGQGQCKPLSEGTRALAEATAARIVQCWNSHDDLVSTLEEIIKCDRIDVARALARAALRKAGVE